MGVLCHKRHNSGEKQGNMALQQPTHRQIAETAARIAAYSKWDEVLDVFRQKAFKVS